MKWAARAGSNYHVVVQLRVRGGRSLAHSNAKIEAAIKGNVRGKSIRFFRTPGRTHFALLFEDISMFNCGDRSPLAVLMDFFGAEVTQVDEVVTSLGVGG